MNAIADQPSASRIATLNEMLLDHLRKIDPHACPGIDGLTLDVVLASYARLAAAGHVPGKAELLLSHPDLTAELEALFATTKSAPSGCPDPVISPLYFEHTD